MLVATGLVRTRQALSCVERRPQRIRAVVDLQEQRSVGVGGAVFVFVRKY